MQFNNLRAADIARQALWDPEGKVSVAWRINELMGEVGEVCNVLKKLHRAGNGFLGSTSTLSALADELADVLICTDLLGMTILIPEVPWLRDVKSGGYVMGNLPQAGCALAATVSRIALFGHSSEAEAALMAYNENKKTVRESLDAACSLVNTLAAMTHIDLPSSLESKFNETSRKHKLSTRLKFNLTERTDP